MPVFSESNENGWADFYKPVFLPAYANGGPERSMQYGVLGYFYARHFLSGGFFVGETATYLSSADLISCNPLPTNTP